MTGSQRQAIVKHGRQLLVIFPHAVLVDPVALCKALRRLEREAHDIGMMLSNGPERPPDVVDAHCSAVLENVNRLLGNWRQDHPPRTGAKCFCKRGVQRDNCPECEGTGWKIDFVKLRARVARPIVPIELNRDPCGYGLKIPPEYMLANNLDLHHDWGGYGILAPEIT
jgi:hypothetical protein